MRGRHWRSVKGSFCLHFHRRASFILIPFGLTVFSLPSANAAQEKQEFPARVMGMLRSLFVSGSTSNSAPKSREALTAQGPASVPSSGLNAAPSTAPGNLISPPAAAPEDTRKAPLCLVDEAAISDLKKAKQDILARQNQISLKEAELVVKEKALSEQLQKLEALRIIVNRIQENQKPTVDAEKVSKLVETLLSMNPKSASKLLSALEDELAVSVMAQMETQRLSKIMSLIEPTRSSRLLAMMVDSKAKKGGIDAGTAKSSPNIQ